MRKVVSFSETGYYADSEPETVEFMADLVKLCRKHKLAIVPTYESRVSFHDSMRVIPLDHETLHYIREAGVHFEESSEKS